MMTEFKFRDKTAYEQWRSRTMYTKEEGTIRWLRTQVQPGDVVYDIGANVGIYTMLAADLVGTLGMVYAFEPHSPSLVALLENIMLNEFGDRVRVISSALHSEEDFIPFNYSKLAAGSSGHQLGHTRNENGNLFTPAATELKHATALDLLILGLHILPADLIKLDVDGNEQAVLQGMKYLLKDGKTRSVQVEVHPETSEAIRATMKGWGFALVEEHHTAIGKESIAKGHSPDQVFRNAVFNRV
jgi:FkbM family methyltransferase